MMILTLALSMMMVGRAMAMSDAEMEARRPGRVKIDVNIGGREYGRYAEALHLVLCPECRAHLKHHCVECDHHKPYPPKAPHKEFRGGKGHPAPHDDGRGRDDDRDGKRPNDRGKGHNNGRR